MEAKNRRASDSPLPAPRVGGSVWPRQHCPAFTPSQRALPGEKECWVCRYADFHLREKVALEVGICCWPSAQID